MSSAWLASISPFLLLYRAISSTLPRGKSPWAVLFPQPHLGTLLGGRGQDGEGEEVPNRRAQAACRAALQAVPGHRPAHRAQTPLQILSGRAICPLICTQRGEDTRDLGNLFCVATSAPLEM